MKAEVTDALFKATEITSVCMCMDVEVQVDADVGQWDYVFYEWYN